MSTPKNRLQEFLQKHKSKLPSYAHQFRNGEWVSTVSFTYNQKGYLFTGGPALKKIEADQEVAEIALSDIEREQCSSKVVVYKTGEIFVPNVDVDLEYIYILVDFENISKIEKLDSLPDSVICLKFISYISPLVASNKANYIIESALPDAVDHYISFYLGGLVQLVPRNKKLNVFILSRDHFAASLPFYVKNISNVEVTHVSTVDSCVSQVETLLAKYESKSKPDGAEC